VLDGFMFSGDTLRTRPDAVRRFVRAWFRAAEHWQAHLVPDTELLEKRLSAKPGSVSLAGIQMFTRDEERRVFEPGSTNRSARHVLSQFVDYFLSRGTLSAAPNVDQLLDPDFLPASK